MISALISGYDIYGQKVTLKLMDSTRVVVTVIANSTRGIRTSMGENFLYTRIAEATFESFVEKRDREFAERMKAAGVLVNSVPAASIVVANALAPALQTPTVDPIEAFRKDRGTGKALQLVGALALSATLIMNSIATDQTQSDIKSGAALKTGYKAPAQMPTAVPIVGSLFFSIGLIVDISAGGHLKKIKIAP